MKPLAQGRRAVGAASEVLGGEQSSETQAQPLGHTQALHGTLGQRPLIKASLGKYRPCGGVKGEVSQLGRRTKVVQAACIQIAASPSLSPCWAWQETSLLCDSPFSSAKWEKSEYLCHR